jgi:hypothetical protein
MGAVSLSSTAKPGTPHTRSGAKQVRITYFGATLVLPTVIAYLSYQDESSSIQNTKKPTWMSSPGATTFEGILSD